MQVAAEQLDIQSLGECRIDSPIAGIRFLENGDRVLLTSSLDAVAAALKRGGRLPAFEKAGPRSKIYFDPSKLKCGIVTCGGLCPGLNDVIRAVVLSLYHNYKVRTVFGFPYGYEGLTYRYGHTPVELDPEAVSRIHEYGGTILGSSRGHQDIGEMVDTLDRMNIGILFTIGGDGTLRGAQAIAEEIRQRGLKIGVVGIPKTIDNDILYVERSFGFATAVSEAVKAIDAAHTEAKGARNGIGLVKLMGRDSGFIAVNASLARSDVNFCLIPESPFALEKLLETRAGDKAVDEFQAQYEKASGQPVKRVNPVLYRREEAEACWREIEAPVLYVVAEQSEFLPRHGEDALPENMARHIGRLEPCWIPGASHMAHHEEPGLLAREIEAFFERT